MKKILFLIGVALGAVACEKDPDMGKLDADLVVYTDHDTNVDFGRFQTYFLPDSILEAGGRHAVYWKDDNAKMIIRKVQENLEKRGYVREMNPDKKDEVDFGVQLSYVSQTNVVTGGYFGGWWDFGFWGPWWGGWTYPFPVTYSYDTNTLVIEMVNLTQKNVEGKKTDKLPVIWYASASGYQYSGRFNQELLLNSVSQAFEQSPYIKSVK